jgi:hypothetical protein
MEVKMVEILLLKPEDEQKLHSHALERLNDWRNRIMREAPQLRQLTVEQLGADLSAYLHDNERDELDSCLNDIKKWLSGCMNTGDGHFPYAYDTQVIAPMSRVESLIMETYRRAGAERRKKEYSERWQAAFLSIKPPVDDAKKYLKAKEHDEFILAMGEAIDTYLEEGTAYLADARSFDYRWWLNEIQERKKKKAQETQATNKAIEYNRRLKQEIVNLTARLEHKQRDLGSYFRSKIRDRRYTSHNFDYVLSKKDQTDFDATLVSMANKRLEQLCPEDVRQFIVLPSQYYRRYYPLPSASYSCEEVPSLDFSFDVFAVAYAEVWLKPANTTLDGYQFLLPWMEDENGLPLLEKPKFLGYYYSVLRPEDLGGHVFLERIPLVLLKGLVNGEAKPGGCAILAASDSDTTYRVSGFGGEVHVPDRFGEFLKSIGSLDKMVDMSVMTEKVGNIVKAAVGEMEAQHEILPAREKAVRRDSMKKRMFGLFDEGKRPGDPEVKALGLKPNSTYRYYQEWKRARGRGQS